MRSHLLFPCNKDPSSVFKVDCEIYRAPLTEFYLLMLFVPISFNKISIILYVLNVAYFSFFPFCCAFPILSLSLDALLQVAGSTGRGWPSEYMPLRVNSMTNLYPKTSVYDIPSISDNKYCANIDI